MSELTLTLIRLGLLVLLWVFIFGVTSVLRSDLYGTRVSRRVLPVRTPKPVPDGRESATPPRKQSSEQGRRARSSPRLPTTVVVTEGQLAGTSLPLGRGGILIGRAPECTLVLDDEFSSGRHARIFARPEGWFVEDLGSRNGTFLGGSRLTGPVPVTMGSVLRVGRTTLELRG
ncbi:FHA domain-containing protein [Dermatophilaceae bacterium Soc4.6]